MIETVIYIGIGAVGGLITGYLLGEIKGLRKQLEEKKK